jgi:hypothetical protein
MKSWVQSPALQNLKKGKKKVNKRLRIQRNLMMGVEFHRAQKERLRGLLRDY